MNELSYMLKRVKLERLVSYLIYDTDANGENIENYEKKLSESYENLFEELCSLYPIVDKSDETFLDIVMKFITVHDNIYFETGVLAGAQLCKNLEQGYKRYVQMDMQDILQKCVKSSVERKNVNEEEILKSLFEDRIVNALEESLKQNVKYQKINKDSVKKLEKVENINLNSKQWKTVDRALSACNSRCLEYGKIAYNQGFKDAVMLLEELSELKL